MMCVLLIISICIIVILALCHCTKTTTNKIAGKSITEPYNETSTLTCVPDSTALYSNLYSSLYYYNTLTNALATSKFDPVTSNKITTALSHFGVLKNKLLNSNNQYIGPPNCSKYCNMASFNTSENITNTNPTCTCPKLYPSSTVAMEVADASVTGIGSKIMCTYQDCNKIPNSYLDPANNTYCICNSNYDPVVSSTDNLTLTECKISYKKVYPTIYDVSGYTIYGIFNSSNMYIYYNTTVYTMDLNSGVLSQNFNFYIGNPNSYGVAGYNPNLTLWAQCYSNSVINLYSFNSTSALLSSISGNPRNIIFTQDSKFMVFSDVSSGNGYLRVCSISPNNTLTQIGVNISFTEQLSWVEVSKSSYYNGKYVILAVTSNTIKVYTFDGATTPVICGTYPISSNSGLSNNKVSFSTDSSVLTIYHQLTDTIYVYTFLYDSNSNSCNVSLVNSLSAGSGGLSVDNIYITLNTKYIFITYSSGIKYYELSRGTIYDNGFLYSVGSVGVMKNMFYNPYNNVFANRLTKNGNYLLLIRHTLS